MQQCCATLREGDTDEKLQRVGLLPSNEEITVEYDRLSGDRLIGADDVPTIILAAKLLRNSFSHRGGDPMPKLRQMIEEKRFHHKLMRFLPDNEFEVVLPMARLVSDIIIAKVELIQAKAEAQAQSDGNKI